MNAIEMRAARESGAGAVPPRSRTLAQRIALWTAACSAISLLIFGAITYFSVLAHEARGPEPETPEEIAHEARRQVGDAMLVAAPISLLLAVAATIWFTRRIVRPLDDVISAAARVTPRDLGQRLPVPRRADEVRDVVIAFNGLLARLERGFGALDRFAVDASHELRTPVAVAAAHLEVMLANAHSSAQWEAAGKTCLEELRRLTHLVDALLDMGRVERTQGTDEAVVDMQRMIERVLTLHRERAQERGIYLGTAPSEAGAGSWVYGDGAALQSAVITIVDNAIQYTPSGGQVLLWLFGEAGGSTLTLHVDDSGPGVAEGEAEQIFEPYARGSVGRESRSGFGLGLAIARRLCERNDGSIAVARSPHGGARFSLTFRLASITKNERAR